MYIPQKSDQVWVGVNNGGGEYEGVWSGPYLVRVDEIRKSHNTGRAGARLPAVGYEDKPLRIQRWPTDNYLYRIVDGNKRLRRAKRLGYRVVLAYVFEGRLKFEVVSSE